MQKYIYHSIVLYNQFVKSSDRFLRNLKLIDTYFCVYVYFYPLQNRKLLCAFNKIVQ